MSLDALGGISIKKLRFGCRIECIGGIFDHHPEFRAIHDALRFGLKWPMFHMISCKQLCSLLILLIRIRALCLGSYHVELTDIYTRSTQHYLSIVVVGRNDAWGGTRFIDKLQLFIDFTSAVACDVSNVSTELVLVDWNPPENEKSMSQLLIWPRYYCKISHSDF
jgi:hypothetical protein